VISAVDTSVLLDVFGADPQFGPRSREALDRCLDEGSLVLSDVVWAETAAAFADPDAAERAMAALGAGFSAASLEAASFASTAWRAYRKAGGSRTRLVADFLVGAHASVQADRLVTRDRGFFRRYFADLPILDPSRRAGQ
jgi:predicted nucleic acid-binding protein